MSIRSSSGAGSHEARGTGPLLRHTVTNLEDLESAFDFDSLEAPRWRQLALEVRRAPSMPEAARCHLIDEIAKRYVRLFGNRVDGKPYHELKVEAAFLAELTKQSLLHMALRLVEIRDRELYRQDGYQDFKSFVEAELPISRSTAYNYIEIIQVFGVEDILYEEDLEYSKLLPVIPLLKLETNPKERERIRSHFLEIAPFRTRREIEREVTELRRHYLSGNCSRCRHGLAPEKMLSLVRENLPSHPTPGEREVLRKLVDLIVGALESGDGRQ